MRSLIVIGIVLLALWAGFVTYKWHEVENFDLSRLSRKIQQIEGDLREARDALERLKKDCLQEYSKSRFADGSVWQ